MPFYPGDLRDEVYARILVKRTALQFAINDFEAAKTWYPYSTLQSLAGDSPKGKVWVVSGTPGDIAAETRTNAGMRYHSVMVAYQRVVKERIKDLAFMDSLGQLVQDLEFMCRKEIGDVTGETNPYAFSRLEYLKDENGVPYQFTMMRKALTFECYFTAFYNIVLS
jgi:hypothetical protein